MNAPYGHIPKVDLWAIHMLWYIYKKDRFGNTGHVGLNRKNRGY
jgi:hypothetical protein